LKKETSPGHTFSALWVRFRISHSGFEGGLKKDGFFRKIFRFVWVRFWMSLSGLGGFGRMATRLATWLAPPHKSLVQRKNWNPKGYIAPTAIIYHSNLELGKHIFIADRVILYQSSHDGREGGSIRLGNSVAILRDSVLETGVGGNLSIGYGTWIHPRCQINAYLASIKIGREVQIAPNCAFYCYDHGTSLNQAIDEQPLQTKGDIIIGDGAWLGVGVIVLSGVRIGKGAVVGAGSVVTRDIPDNAIACGIPAKVVNMRKKIESDNG
jgi:acetyltransferase-like isoleucine patch superfamily enzyme